MLCMAKLLSCKHLMYFGNYWLLGFNLATGQNLNYNGVLTTLLQCCGSDWDILSLAVSGEWWHRIHTAMCTHSAQRDVQNTRHSSVTAVHTVSHHPCLSRMTTYESRHHNARAVFTDCWPAPLTNIHTCTFYGRRWRLSVMEERDHSLYGPTPTSDRPPQAGLDRGAFSHRPLRHHLMKAKRAEMHTGLLLLSRLIIIL